MNSDAAAVLRVFAYGSNLCVQRLLARAPGATVVATGALHGHVLRWHKRGRDGSGKCDAWATGVERDAVHGAVYAMPAADKAMLDRCEGLGVHYFEKTVRVRTTDGAETEACVYVANPAFVDEGAVPWTWYRDFVLAGARQHRLPGTYIEAIARVHALPDPDSARERHETSVLRAPA